jgi:transcriptional regulator GlxA family with amidase domain
LIVVFGYHCYPGNCDLLFVAGGPWLRGARPEADFLCWLGRQANASLRFGSVYSGTFLLGYAGLLDGREVTAHCRDVERLEDQFPLVLVRPNRIFVRDGQLFTCAGVSAGIDLCLSLVAEDWGHELATAVAKRLVVYMQRDAGQSQSSPFLASRPEEESIVSTVLRYVTDHMSEAFSMEQLADAVSVSRRTFSRLFAKYANVTPAVFVEQVRVDHARKLLENTDSPLKTVAYECGFHSATHMRMIFSRRLDTTPRQYRERFRNTEKAAKTPQRAPISLTY